MGEDEAAGSVEANQRFLRLFGVSREELRRQGVDVRQYVHEHSASAAARIYGEAADRRRAGSSLLPYWAPNAWVGTGRTRLEGGLGSVDITAASVRIVDMSGSVSDIATANLSVRRVPVWFGLGQCLVAGDERWFVQPWYSPSSPRRGWKANRVFRRALLEAMRTAPG